MPINYLARVKNYDGVINKIDDSGRTGSVKYFFNEIDMHNYGIFGARGYRPEFKRREPLRGHLIFTEP